MLTVRKRSPRLQRNKQATTTTKNIASPQIGTAQRNRISFFFLTAICIWGAQLYLRSDTQCMLDRCDTAAPGLHCMSLLWFKLSISTGPTEDNTSTVGVITAFRSCYRPRWQGHTMVTKEVLPPTTWLHSSKALLKGHQWTTRGRWNYSCQFILTNSEVLTYLFAVYLSLQYFQVVKLGHS